MIAGLLIGIVLLCEAVPVDGGTVGGTTTTISHSIASGCSKRCDDPDATEFTTTETFGSDEGEGSVEAVLDGDAGAVLICFIAALVAALLTYLVVRQLALGAYSWRSRRAKTMDRPLDVPAVTETQARLITLAAWKDRKLGDAFEQARSEAKESTVRHSSLGPTGVRLANLQGKVEDAVHELARAYELTDEHRPIEELLLQLARLGAIDGGGRLAILGLIEICERAKEGAEVDPELEQWLTSEAEHLPAALWILAAEARA